MRIEAGIYTRAIESRNILEKQYIRKRERSNDVTIQCRKKKESLRRKYTTERKKRCAWDDK